MLLKTGQGCLGIGSNQLLTTSLGMNSGQCAYFCGRFSSFCPVHLINRFVFPSFHFSSLSLFFFSPSFCHTLRLPKVISSGLVCLLLYLSYSTTSPLCNAIPLYHQCFILAANQHLNKLATLTTFCSLYRCSRYFLLFCLRSAHRPLSPSTKAPLPDQH